MPRATARPVCEAFAQALRAYGVPQAVLTDNGRVFSGRHAKARHEVLFDRICYHAEGRVHVRSAGSTPADEINPAVIAAMDEVGVDLSKEFPKPLTTEVVQAADVVVTMGCGDACPIFPGKRYLDWELPDPAGRDVEEVRAIRDEIDARIKALLAELVPTSA
jgi:protein-tyrosine-phosphatase